MFLLLTQSSECGLNSKEFSLKYIVYEDRICLKNPILPETFNFARSFLDEFQNYSFYPHCLEWYTVQGQTW